MMLKIVGRLRRELMHIPLSLLFWPIRLENAQRLPVIGPFKGERAATARCRTKQPSGK